uniref:Uncharacterized protein n=1 Tax=Pyrodinium bahamense TaxID=73915 RepID=A0A7R9ZYQ1_9DINO|mmetsp:Transcript_14559/g.40199  ORF Transcript_14559/g.40199 Transcript_14559/m.40199 type:complete len:434 (+) Transcript_14559:34-1335(+)
MRMSAPIANLLAVALAVVPSTAAALLGDELGRPPHVGGSAVGAPSYQADDDDDGDDFPHAGDFPCYLLQRDLSRGRGRADNVTSSAESWVSVLGFHSRTPRAATIPYKTSLDFRSIRSSKKAGKGSFVWTGSYAYLLVFVIPLLVFNYVLTVQYLDRSVKSHLKALVIFTVMSVCYGAVFWIIRGSDEGLQWTLGYLMEYPLSMELVMVYFLALKNHKVPADQTHKAVTLGLYLALFVKLVLLLIMGDLPYPPVLLLLSKVILLWLCGASFLCKSGKEGFDLEEYFWVQLVFRGRLQYKEDGSVFVCECGKLPVTRLAFSIVILMTWELFFALCHTASKGWYVSDPFINLTSTLLGSVSVRAFFFVLQDFVSYMSLSNVSMAVIVMLLGVEVGVNIWVETPLVFPVVVLVVGLAMSALVQRLLPAKALPAPAG